MTFPFLQKCLWKSFCLGRRGTIESTLYAIHVRSQLTSCNPCVDVKRLSSRNVEFFLKTKSNQSKIHESGVPSFPRAQNEYAVSTGTLLYTTSDNIIPSLLRNYRHVLLEVRRKHIAQMPWKRDGTTMLAEIQGRIEGIGQYDNIRIIHEVVRLVRHLLR